MPEENPASPLIGMRPRRSYAKASSQRRQRPRSHTERRKLGIRTMGGFFPGKLFQTACTSGEDSRNESSLCEASQVRICKLQTLWTSLRTRSNSICVTGSANVSESRASAVTGKRDLLKPTTVHQEFRVLRRMLNIAVRKRLLGGQSVFGSGVPSCREGHVSPSLRSMVRTARIESHAPEHLGNIVQIITETGLRIYKELTPMRKDNVDLANAVVWIPDSKTPNGIAEIPLTPLAVQAFQRQFAISGDGPFLFPSDLNPSGHHKNLRKAWKRTLSTSQSNVLSHL